jgi:VCBS repeat protein
VVSVTACCLLSVFLGNGDGSFQPQVDYNVLGPGEVLTADFNGDGVLDLAVILGTGDGGLVTLLGNGDGTFETPRVVDSNAHLGCGFGLSMVITDFNGDGKPDLAYCEQDVPKNLGKIWVALGKGDGTFKKPVSIVVHAYGGVFEFAAGDFNSDGQTDLVANYFTSSKFNQTKTDLFLGNGYGTFRKKKIITLPGSPYYNAESGIAPADFNSDGLLDFVSLASGEADVFVQK